MIPIAQYWHQQDCPPAILSRQKQWQNAFPERYERFDRDSTVDFLADHFDSEIVSGFLACAVPTMASDYFRYHRLAASGGFYIDSAFIPGDPASIVMRTDYPVFMLSVPTVDLTPAIVQARQVLGKVLLIGILRTQAAPCPYFSLMARLVRRLIGSRASDQIPMVTGVGALTAFSYAVSTADNDPQAIIKAIQHALLPGHDRFLAVVREFVEEHIADLRTLTPCVSADSEEMKDLFFRPAEDISRLSDPAHWSNHQGDIFAAVPDRSA